MDEQRKAEIERLAEIAFDKRLRVEQLGLMATPMEAQARRDAAIEYAVAKAERYEAEEKLEEAIKNTEISFNKKMLRALQGPRKGEV